MARVSGAIVAAMVATGLLAGCSSSDVEVDLRAVGASNLEVGPCVALAGDASLRPETSTPTKILIEVVSSTQEITASATNYLVTGTTTVRADTVAVYGWECIAEFSSSDASVSAWIVEFQAK